MELLSDPAVVASVIAAIAGIFAVVASLKTNSNSNKIQKEVGKLQLLSNDKQRLIEVISTQRVQWINEVRKCFAEFNTNAYIFSSAITQVTIQKTQVTDEMNNLIPRMINQIEVIELFLNPVEVVAEKQIQSMDKIIDLFTQFTHDFYKSYGNQEKLLELMKAIQTNYKNERDQMMYFQQVILKVEWKRVKLETEKGRQISKKEMNCMFEEVAQQIDPDMYVKLLKKDFDKISYYRKDCFDEIY